MKFHLEFSIPPPAAFVQLQQPLLICGSCFSEHIGQRLYAHRFPTLVNPHGIVFNPISINKQLTQYGLQKVYTREDLVQDGQLWHSLEHHGRFSGTNLEEVLAQINRELAAGAEMVRKAGWIIITLGSAWVYAWKQTGEVVSNCHKIPQQQFAKRLLQPPEMIQSFEKVYNLVKELNPGVRFLFSVSPVRYIRDGLVENNRSKAALLQTVHAITAQFGDCFYFPAYELVTDVLRDYRFYEADLVHPNQLAIQYVWEKFTTAMLDPESRQFVTQYGNLLKSRHHRLLHATDEAHEKFKQHALNQLADIQTKWPFVDLSEDQRYFETL